MFETGKRRMPMETGTALGIAAVAVVLIGVQIGALAVLVGHPLEDALVAAREPTPSGILVRVPEYVEELEVVGPPRWERDLLRFEAARRSEPMWLADRAAAPVPFVCPASR